MLEVHAPHESVHTWRDFFIHIATIVVGLLIAVGLEQTVEAIHRHHQLAEARESLRLEYERNQLAFSFRLTEFRRCISLLQGNLADFLYLQKHPGTPLDKLPNRINWNGLRAPYMTPHGLLPGRATSPCSCLPTSAMTTNAITSG